MTAAQHTLKRSIAPEGNTPGKPEPKLRSTSTNRAKKTLFGNVKASTESGSRSSWSNDEVKALVQYICLYWPQAWTNKWPVTKEQIFGKIARKPSTLVANLTEQVHVFAQLLVLLDI